MTLDGAVDSPNGRLPHWDAKVVTDWLHLADSQRPRNAEQGVGWIVEMMRGTKWKVTMRPCATLRGKAESWVSGRTELRRRFGLETMSQVLGLLLPGAQAVKLCPAPTTAV